MDSGHDRLDLTAPVAATLPAPGDGIGDPEQGVFSSPEVSVFDVGSRECGLELFAVERYD
ncbi:hypothetical protein OH799_12050 [Nocardia sp. NBC_00881]|uniref:hypothetical protein n=1 Tax=Nocardia sp. NBC_00881 TaxID=2975995 RepID=UPI0038660ED4|nr:hypothetical protein OH799_12050 [Nocardia sp. NBC_00881]